MYTRYRLNADELTPGFLDALKTLFKHKTIEISVCDAEQIEQDETAYLLANPANRVRLLEAVENVANGQNLVLDLGDNAPKTALLSEHSLSADWARPEGDGAWSHLQ